MKMNEHTELAKQIRPLKLALYEALKVHGEEQPELATTSVMAALGWMLCEIAAATDAPTEEELISAVAQTYRIVQLMNEVEAVKPRH
jgi:hypothetical protein